MRAIIKAPGHPASRVIIPNELELFQQLVGGFIEIFPIASDCVILCDEEGKLKGKPFNCNFCGEDFVGTILFVGVDGDEFTDVPVAALEALEEGRLV